MAEITMHQLHPAHHDGTRTLSVTLLLPQGNIVCSFVCIPFPSPIVTVAHVLSLIDVTVQSGSIIYDTISPTRPMSLASVLELPFERETLKLRVTLPHWLLLITA